MDEKKSPSSRNMSLPALSRLQSLEWLTASRELRAAGSGYPGYGCVLAARLPKWRQDGWARSCTAYARNLLVPGLPMLKSLSICLCLLSAPLMAAEWTYEGGSTPIAYFDNGDAQFQFACRGGDLAMAYWTRKPAPAVAEAKSMSLAINASGAVIAASNTNFAQDLPLIHSDGSSVVVRGPVAKQWARIAQQAGETIQIAYVRSKSDGALEFFDRQSFGAKGSSSTVAKVLGQCG